jgi:hypothetical protein
MASTASSQRHSPLAGIIDAFEGMAFIFDIAGVMHPGNDQHPDPWIAARDDIAEAWQEASELLGWAINSQAGGAAPIESPSE